jgi:tetratricopeptide (TPR) repeat protein
MPNTARILKFPTRSQRVQQELLSQREVSSRVREYLETPLADRSPAMTDTLFSNADCVAAFCASLREEWNSAPAAVAIEATGLYEWMKAAVAFGGLFDEREYFQGEAALLTAGAHRLLGNRDLVGRWLDRAESSFRHTVNPAPLAAEVTYMRLALKYDEGQYDDVIEFTPSLMTSYEKLGMEREAVKAGLLNGVTLKVTGRTTEALALLVNLCDRQAVTEDPKLRGHLLVDIGDIHQIEGRTEQALAVFREALPLFDEDRPSISRVNLRLAVGSLCRAQNLPSEAIESFREALADLASLKMPTRAAFVQVILAESLIAMNRYREAEWELRTALPTIEEQKMVPEGFAAVALLKEAIRQRKSDPNALRELREHLQASNQK